MVNVGVPVALSAAVRCRAETESLLQKVVWVIVSLHTVCGVAAAVLADQRDKDPLKAGFKVRVWCGVHITGRRVETLPHNLVAIAICRSTLSAAVSLLLADHDDSCAMSYESLHCRACRCSYHSYHKQ